MRGAARRRVGEPLDRVRQAALRDMLGDSGVLELLVGSFRADTPTAITSLRDALEARDVCALNDEAHKLKGICLTLGVPVMAHLCRSLEGPGVPDGARGVVAALAVEFERVDAALS